jgi:hypothetical protein
VKAQYLPAERVPSFIEEVEASTATTVQEKPSRAVSVASPKGSRASEDVGGGGSQSQNEGRQLRSRPQQEASRQVEIVDVDMADEGSIATEGTGATGSEKSKGKRRLTLSLGTVGSIPKRKRVAIADLQAVAGQKEGDQESMGHGSFTPSERASREKDAERSLPTELGDLSFTTGDDVDLKLVPKLYQKVSDS